METTQTKELLNFQDVVNSNSEEAKKYHSEIIKIEIFERVLKPVFLIILALLLVPNYLSDANPAGSDFSVISSLWLISVYYGIIYISWLPLSIYGESVERRFEMSNRNNKKFFVDQIKKLILSLVLMNAAFLGLFGLINTTGDNWWLYSFVAFFLVVGVMSSLSPYIITLFMKLKKMENEAILDRVNSIGKKMGLENLEVFEMQMSSQTKKANAMVMGMGKTVRVVITDTMIEKFMLDEIEFVIGHELGHYKDKHVYKLIGFVGMISIIVFFAIDQLFIIFGQTFQLNDLSDMASVGFIWAIFSISFEILFIFIFGFSRRIEKKADLMALDVLPNYEIFESTFARLASVNLSYPDPSNLEIILNKSHPSLKQRIEYGRKYLENSTN